MNRYLTPNQILLTILATALLLLTAFSFYLLQDPNAPLPFSPLPPTTTGTPLPPPPTNTPAPSATARPTRQTSYTPFAASATQVSGTPPAETGTSTAGTSQPAVTGSPLPPTNTSTSNPGSSTTTLPGPTSTRTLTPTPGTAAPTVSPTLGLGEHEVNGRIVRKGTPVANVMVYFSDDVSPRSDTTNQGGHYRFTTLAPGTNFLLTFSRADNPQLTPTAEIAFNAWIEGNLLTGVDIITLPDFEISLTLENIFFELQAPTDGAVFSAAAINSSNPLMFIWNPYNQGDSYYIELGANNSGGLSWASNMTTSNYIMWDGNLSDGSHVTEGSYWWRVIVRNAVGNYTLYIQSDDWDLLFNP